MPLSDHIKPDAHRPPTREEIERGRAMYVENFTTSRICAATGMSLGTLYYWLDGGPQGHPTARCCRRSRAAVTSPADAAARCPPPTAPRSPPGCGAPPNARRATSRSASRAPTSRRPSASATPACWRCWSRRCASCLLSMPARRPARAKKTTSRAIWMRCALNWRGGSKSCARRRRRKPPRPQRPTALDRAHRFSSCLPCARRHCLLHERRAKRRRWPRPSKA